MKKLLALILAMCMVFSLAACGGGGDDDTGGTGSPSPSGSTPGGTGGGTNSPAPTGGGEDGPVGDKTLKLYIAGFQNLDPQIWSWGTHACRMGIFEGLTMMNPDFTTRLAAAESLEHNDDYTVWTAKVRSGMTWSDGEVLDANDFFYSFERIMDPQNLAGKTASIVNSDVANIILNLSALQRGECDFEDVGVKLIDDYTIEFTLATPCDRFDYRLAESWALPVPQHTIEQHGDNWTTPENIVVNGPFIPVARDADVHLQLAKNTAYWDVANVALETVDIYAGAQDQYLSYQAGDINVATIATGNYEAVLASEYADQIQYYDTSIVSYLGMIKTADNPLIEHPEIREAISLSIDREVLCNDVMLGMRTPAETLIYPGFASWASDLNVISTTANVEKAQQLMAQAGFPNGEGLEPMTLLIAGTADGYTLALANMIETGTGIKVNIVNLEWAAFVTERNSYHTDGMWGYWSDSWNCGVPFPSGAFVNYQFDVRENLLPNNGLEMMGTALINGGAAADKAAAMATCTDPDAIAYGQLYDQVTAMGATPEADELYRQLEIMRLESYTFIPLSFVRTAKLVAPTMTGFNGNPTLLDAAPFNFKDVSNG